MSSDYASRLSSYENKGVCGVPEVFDDPEKLREKMKALSEMLASSRHVVVHTGAGISTSAGIPDFRGPKGVWTLEKAGKRVEVSKRFEDTEPTLTHQALVVLAEAGYIKHVVSQNVDGLHLKSGLPRASLSELHGNVFMERCEKCGREYVRETVVPTIGLQYTGNRCEGGGAKGRCRGKLRDTVLDWEDELPEEDSRKAEHHSSRADLSLCLGTTLQIVPAGNLPLRTKKNHGQLAICNLQPTKHDRKADLLLHGYVDDVMVGVLQHLGLSLPTNKSSLQVAGTSSHSAAEQSSSSEGTNPCSSKEFKSSSKDSPIHIKTALRSMESAESCSLEHSSKDGEICKEPNSSDGGNNAKSCSSNIAN